MQSLTSAQATAVNTFNKSIIINANAGAGKTSVLIQRILYLLREHEIPLEDIVAITFTEKASEELKDRLREALKKSKLENYNLENSYISTIHAFCARVLREQCFEAGLSPHFNILSNSTEQEVMLEETAEEILDLWLGQDDSRIITLLETYKTKDLIKESTELLNKFRSAGFEPEDLKNLKITDEFWLNLDKVLADIKPWIFKETLQKLSSLNVFKSFLPENFNDYLAEVEVLAKKDYSLQSFAELESWFNKKPRRERRSGAAEKDNFFERFTKEFRKQKENFTESCALLNYSRETENNYQALYSAVLDFCQEVYCKYQQKKTQGNQLDFEDLLLSVKKLFKGNVGVREHYKNKFKQIMLDEFQDTNQLQWDIFKLIAGEQNLFIVGDWKQSIYRFRNADVYIFLDLIKNVSAHSQKNIQLQENFRSGKPILEITNYLAKYIWPAEKYDYHDLIYSADKAAYPLHDSRVKINFITDPTIDERGNKEQKRYTEALVLVQEIKELLKAGKKLRDMAILLRATSDLDIYEETLRNQDISFITYGGRYYYQRQEIVDLINFVKILNNPLLDLTLAGVFRSPLVGLRDESLLLLCRQRDQQGQKHLFNILNEESIAESLLLETDKRKLLSFIRLYNFLTENIGKFSLSGILLELAEKTQYFLYLFSQPDGEQKVANVRKFIELARTLNEDTNISLPRFVRYLEKMQEREAREEEALSGIEDEQIKIMTIHKAKGLEFPIVFLPDINRESGRNKSDIFSFDYNSYRKYNLPFGFYFKEISGEAFSSHLHRLHGYLFQREEIEESKRLFYVALTRAKEKLVISTIVEENLSPAVFHTSGNWGRWLSFLYQQQKKELANYAELNLVKELPVLPVIRKSKEPVNFITDLGNTYQILLNRKKEVLAYSKLSATELADSAHGLEYFLEKNYYDFPSEAEKKSLFNRETAEYIGNTVHYYIGKDKKLYEKNVPDKQKKYIQKCLDNYFHSELAKDVGQSAEKYFEIDFDFFAPSLQSILSQSEDKGVFVNGRIDLLFKDRNNWHIVDFKTNQKSPENLKEYTIQLSVYAEALAKLLKIEIAEIKLKIYYLYENELLELEPIKDVVNVCLKELQ